MDPEIPEKRAKLENENVTTGWFDLPFEMREMIIKMMDFKTLCIFAQCSKSCAEEVKESEMVMFEISLYRLSSVPKHLDLCVGNGNRYCNDLYYLEFIEMNCSDGSKTEVIYFKSGLQSEDIEKWRTLENGDAEEVRIRYLDDFIEEYYKNICQVEIHDSKFPAWRYDMRKLSEICTIEDYSERDLLESKVFDLSQITDAGKVVSEGTNITFDQLINLKGWRYELKCDELDEKTIATILKMLKKAEFGTNLDILELHLNLHRFPDEDTITEGLDVSYDTDNDFGLSFNFKSDVPKRRYFKCTMTQTKLKVFIE